VTAFFHVFASYDDGQIDPDGVFSLELDANAGVVGAGVNYPLSETVDLVGQAAWVRLEVENFDEDGLGLFGGVRAMVTPRLELNGGVSYVDIDDSDDPSLDVGLVYSFTDRFAVRAGASFSDAATSLGIGVRLYFQ
jgi:hypothetical protein